MKNKVLNKIKSNQYFILGFICLILFLFILINVLNGSISSFDASIYNIISGLKSNFITMFFKTITRLGNAEVLIVIALICLVFIKDKKIGANIAINLASIGLLNHILKEIIQRPRPPLELRMVEENSFSFPSGHAMASMAFYGLIIYFILNKVQNKKIKIFLFVFLSTVILFVGISRIYLGVHYASDVLAGFLFSIAYLVLYITCILKLFKL